MASAVAVRQARVDDAPQMARVHVDSWRHTYRGLMSDALLDDPGLLQARELFWIGALTDERWSSNRIALAETGSVEADGTVIGIAMSGPAHEPGTTWDWQLHVLYVEATHHGRGVGAALLDAVLHPHETATSWVADPNPRAQAFYRKHGFTPDGHTRTDHGVREIRWVRHPASW